MTDSDRKKAQNARKKKSRAKQAAHEKACGKRTIELDVYQGTSEQIKRLCQAGGFEDEKEMLTILIRNADEDIAQFGDVMRLLKL